MKLELPRWMSTSPWVELFLPITTLLCLTRYSNSFPDILAMGVFEIWLFPFTGLGGAMVASFSAKRAQASAWASYLIFCWGLGASVAMLSDQCRVRAYTDWPVHPVFVLCCAQLSPGESQQSADVTTPVLAGRRADRHRALERTTCPIINMLSCSIKWLQFSSLLHFLPLRWKELGKDCFYNFSGRHNWERICAVPFLLLQSSLVYVTSSGGWALGWVWS